ncbi:hypothetical protein JCM5350_000431 [Sporobolomyces pararoseus]
MPSTTAFSPVKRHRNDRNINRTVLFSIPEERELNHLETIEALAESRIRHLKLYEPSREKELSSLLSEILQKAALNGDRVRIEVGKPRDQVTNQLFQWEKRYKKVFSDSTKTRFALEVIKRDLESVLKDVENGKRLTEGVTFSRDRQMKRKYWAIKDYGTLTSWRKAEIESSIDSLEQHFSKTMSKSDRKLLQNWSKKIKSALKNHLVSTADKREAWYQVKCHKPPRSMAIS